MLIRIALVLLVAVASVLSAQTQVADVVTEPMQRSSYPQKFVQVGSTTYFQASGSERIGGYVATDIWKTDGTTEGTQLVIDLRSNSATPQDMGTLLLTGFQDELYFFANLVGDATHAPIYHLWRIDSSTGEVVPVKEIPGLEYIPEGVVANGKLFFTGVAAPNGQAELWVTDGTPEGTHAVTDPQHAAHPFNLTVVENEVYFSAASDSTGREIWKTDGTVAGTNLVIDLYPGSEPGTGAMTTPYDAKMAEFGGELYFSGSDGSTPGFGLWKTDGTAAGTVLVTDIDPSWSGGSPNSFVVHDGAMFFRATDAAGRELWKTDGTTAGTVLVKDINTSDDSDPRFLTSTPWGLMFDADDGVHGRQPWLSDGTSTGTKMLKELPIPGNPAYTVERHFSVTESDVYFIAVDPTVSEYFNLYRTDGTPEGTTAVQGDHGGAEVLHSTGSQVLFPDLGDGELWTVTGVGTQRVKDLALDAGSLPTAPGAPVGGLFGSQFVFTGNVGTYHAELWVSDGTTPGTSLLKEVSTAHRPSAYSPLKFVTHGGLAFFTAFDDASNTHALWKTNGTHRGTIRLSHDNFGGTPVGVVEDRVIFHGYWAPVIGTSDGTVSGTQHFDVPSLDDILSSAVAGGKMYFYASTTSGGLELWVSDGTPSGTLRLSSASPYPGSIPPFAPAHEFKSDVYFLTYGSGSRSELRKTDGTQSGTEFVCDWNELLWRTSHPNRKQLDAANANGRMFFTGADESNGIELWVSGGTSWTTNILLDIYPGERSSSPEHLTHYNGRVYFSATTPNHGRELWVSNGTESGTYMLADINPGVLSSGPEDFHVFDGLLYFSAFDNPHGRELWRTDGTAEGTERVSDINPGPGNASPSAFFEADGDLYFTAFRVTDGRELWRISGSGGGGSSDDGGGCAAVGASGGLAPAALAVLAVALARRRTRRARPKSS